MSRKRLAATLSCSHNRRPQKADLGDYELGEEDKP